MPLDHAPDAEPANDRYTLIYKFKAGEEVRSQVVHRATINTTIKGNTQTAETRTSSVKLWKFTATGAAGELTLLHAVESIDMWQRMQGRQEVKYNSRTDEEAPPGYEDVAKAVGVPLTEVVIDAHGKVKSRKELHTQSNANPMPLVIPLPDEPIAIGHEWFNPVELEVRLQSGANKKIETRQRFKLAKVEKGVATIEIDAQVLTPVHDAAIDAQLIQRLPTGSLRFDLDGGRILSQEMDVDKHVIGFNGPASSMHYLSRYSEEALSAADQGGTNKTVKSPSTSPGKSAAKAPPQPANITARGAATSSK